MAHQARPWNYKRRFDLSLVSLRRCPVLGCKFNKHPVSADLIQLKKHIRYDHDYREKQETSFELGLIDSPFEKRSVTWFVDSLSNFSKTSI